jgi:hypothetical protein
MAFVNETVLARPGPDAPCDEHLQPRGFMEHRWGYRHAANVAVSFALQSGRRSGVGRVLNISTTGAYLQTEMPLRILTLIDLTFIDGLVPRGTRFTACVMRRDQCGVGLEWEAPIRLPTADSRTATNPLGIALHGLFLDDVESFDALLEQSSAIQQKANVP